MQTPDEIKQKKREWYYKNKERATLKKKEWYAANKDKQKAYDARYYQENKAASNAKKAKRRSLILGASCNNTDIDTLCIKIMYSIAESKEGDYHIDHIHPLSKGGAHHPMNLQILTAEENLKKGDRI